MSMRSAASVSQLFAVSRLPRGARIVRVLSRRLVELIALSPAARAHPI
jgi:hypothetical protein